MYQLKEPNLKTMSSRLYSTAPAFVDMDKANLPQTLDALGKLHCTTLY